MSHFKQKEILDSVARIMAAESIVIVEKQGISTASFDLVNRIVYIPIWNDKDLTYENHVALRSHEVGHAVWTPSDSKLFEQLAKDGILAYVNVIEDIRINEFLKRKYPGLIKIFNTSYRQFFDTNFYGVDHSTVNDLDFADRINIAFKVGSYAGVRFTTEEERNFIAKLDDILSFNQVLDLARELADIVRKKKQESNGGSNGNGDLVQVLMLSTEESFDQALKQHVLDKASASDLYTIHAKYNMKRHIKPYPKFVESVESLNTPLCQEIYRNYKKNNQSLISYMVKEFEMLKSAKEYQNLSMSESGVIDPLKTYKYAFDENIFLRKSVIPTGKNHGLVMFVDWSGSMSTILQNTLFQIFNIVLFCKRLSIPFVVYLFRDEFTHNSIRVKPCLGIGLNIDDLQLVEILNHEMSIKDFNVVMNVLSDAKKIRTSIPEYCLTGTPLNECIILSRGLVLDFIKKNRLEKTSILFLTDGESTGLVDPSAGDILFSQYSKYQTIVGPMGLTASLLNTLKFETQLNICGIYISVSDKAASLKISKSTTDEAVSLGLNNTYRNKGFVALEGLGYDKLYVVDKSLINKEMFKTTHNNSFSDTRKTRMQSMVFLRSFIEMIA